MTLAIRPLLAVMLLCLASGSVSAAKQKSTAGAAPSACTDFYSNSNKGWLLANPLPANTPSLSRWDQLGSAAEQRTSELLAKSQPGNPGVASALLADLVASAQDEAGLDAAARAAAQPLLAQINSIRKPRDIAKVVAALHAAGVPVLFGFDVLRDPDNGQPRATFYPGGIGLPDPVYYSSTAPEPQLIARLYAVYLRAMLEFSGVTEATIAQQADWAYATEKSLAAAMGPQTRVSATVIEANKAYPALFLSDFMQAQGAAPEVVAIHQSEFFAALDRMMVKPAIPQWQAYLRAQVARSLVATTAKDPRQPYTAALGGASGSGATVPAAKRLAGLTALEGAELLSSAYAETHLTEAGKQQATAIGESIRASMGRAIDRAAWLSTEGKSASKRKLEAMRLAIGLPLYPVSFEGLRFDRSSYAGNVLALRRWNRQRSLALLNTAIWPWPISQTRPVIGYQAADNRLIATASALNPPVFGGTSAASDYGSFGALLAQQMSLGFTDYKDGDGAALASRQAGLVAQSNGHQVNGARTLRQNAADLAGLEIAWDALNEKGAPTPASSKEFFSAWAAVWARQDSPAALASAQSQSDFSPAKWRVNGPLSNMPSFAKTFACKAGQPMARAEKDQLAIWR
ncbi:MAG: M13 family metallopeptidase [Arenimonas sp.]|nr:M13 family metallopeptidase [Arenimonas sp.]